VFDVRVAIPADAEQLGDVYAEAWRVGEGVCCPPEVFDDELELRRKIFPVLARRAQRHSVTRLDQEAHIRGTLLVAESAGRVVGFIHFGPMDQGSMRGYRPLNGEDLGEVYRIYVHPTVRGQGCARLLMDEAVAAMAETYRSGRPVDPRRECAGQAVLRERRVVRDGPPGGGHLVRRFRYRHCGIWADTRAPRVRGSLSKLIRRELPQSGRSGLHRT